MATKTIKEAGINCSYYFGAKWGCLLSGWISDNMGRVMGLQLGCLWCMLGIALEASAYNSNWISCARMIAGIGVAHMNAIAPTWISKVSEAAHRGRSFSLVYLATYLGIALVYWLSFDPSFIDGCMGPIRWRLPFAIDVVFPLFLSLLLPFVPESPLHPLLKRPRCRSFGNVGCHRL